MNEREVGQLLSVLATIDSKLPVADDAALLRRIWLGLLADVPAEAAQTAVEHYYRSERYLTSREPIAPADIVQWWNARRRPNRAERRGGGGQPSQPQLALERPAPAKAERVREVMTRMCTELGWKPTHSVMLAVACPECGAEPGKPCTRRSTRGTDVDTWPHTDRRQAAERAATATQQRHAQPDGSGSDA